MFVRRTRQRGGCGWENSGRQDKAGWFRRDLSMHSEEEAVRDCYPPKEVPINVVLWLWWIVRYVQWEQLRLLQLQRKQQQQQRRPPGYPAVGHR
ncbi:unnamed protein product [Ectocarpus sp. 12 AP-2014]